MILKHSRIHYSLGHHIPVQVPYRGQSFKQQISRFQEAKVRAQNFQKCVQSRQNGWLILKARFKSFHMMYHLMIFDDSALRNLTLKQIPQMSQLRLPVPS